MSYRTTAQPWVAHWSPICKPIVPLPMMSTRRTASIVTPVSLLGPGQPRVGSMAQGSATDMLRRHDYGTVGTRGRRLLNRGVSGCETRVLYIRCSPSSPTATSSSRSTETAASW